MWYTVTEPIPRGGFRTGRYRSDAFDRKATAAEFDKYLMGRYQNLHCIPEDHQTYRIHQPSYDPRINIKVECTGCGAQMISEAVSRAYVTWVHHLYDVQTEHIDRFH